MQYQPALRPDQIESLYHLKVELRRPMTKLAREAVDCFLQEMKRKEEHARRAGTRPSQTGWLTNGRWKRRPALRPSKPPTSQTLTPSSEGLNRWRG